LLLLLLIEIPLKTGRRMKSRRSVIRFQSRAPAFVPQPRDYGVASEQE
jgi:hypothetical protein